MALTVLGLGLLTCLPPTVAFSATGSMQEVTAVIGKQAFEVEVAIDQEDFYRGLMYRKALAADHGMLFPFFPAKSVSFWMKNTLIPLDMLFIRDQKIRHIVNRAQPCRQDPCPTFASEAVVDMVIELPAGSAERLGLKPGSRVRLYSDNPLPGNRAMALKMFPKSAMARRVHP